MGCLFIFMSLMFLSAELPSGFLAACEQLPLLPREGSGSGCDARGRGGDHADRSGRQDATLYGRQDARHYLLALPATVWV